MKKKCFKLAIWLTCIISSLSAHDPLLVIVLMVKNEAPVIQATLQPFMEAAHDSSSLGFFIFDTGSTDATIELTEQLFNNNSVHNYTIMQEPFVDFATSRNRALRLAEEYFPHACFMLMLDAEWYLHNIDNLVTFCKQEERSSDHLYLMRIMNDEVDFTTPRLIRCNTGIHFIGVVHEVPNEVTYEKVPDTHFEWRPTKYGNDKSYLRFFRDRDLLLRAYEKNPYDPRTLFYLAQTYACLGDLENACLWYKRHTELPSYMVWDEEAFMAHYRRAQLLDTLGKWSEALAEYLTAHAMRPHRAEPLVSIAQHYWNVGEYATCFMFAQRATELPYPEHDLLFIEKEIYNFCRYDLLSRSAWYVGEYEVGYQALLTALQAHPNFDYLYTNLVLYRYHNTIFKAPATEPTSISHQGEDKDHSYGCQTNVNDNIESINKD